jgi:lipopolysaccharide export system permease protein
MTIIDRYLIAQFCKIFVVCFVSFAGLYVVIHVFTNLDEVMQIGSGPDGTKNLIGDFYLPRVLDFFNRSAGILILIAAVFSIGLMQRRRETTATEAAGISKARLVRPVLIVSVAVVAFAAICREQLIPHYKDLLVRNLVNWTTRGTVPMHHTKDWGTGILVKGDELNIDQSKITKIQLTLPRQVSPEVADVQAENGWIKNGVRGYPIGVLCENIIVPKNVLSGHNVVWNGRTIIHTPRESPWLLPNQLFVECALDVNELAYGENLFRYSSTPEMIASLKKPNRRLRLGDRVSVHERILKPILELTLLLIGLPLVVADPNRNIFVGAAYCLGVIMAIEATVAISHALGSYGLIQSAELAAWIPVLIFVPLSVFALKRLFD